MTPRPGWPAVGSTPCQHHLRGHRPRPDGRAAWARTGFFYKIWSEGDPRDWLKIEARVDECKHISAVDLDRERRSMPASAFAREYENVFDSLESRFFDAAAIAAAFGAVVGPTPPLADGDLDPIITRTPAFGERAFFS